MTELDSMLAALAAKQQRLQAAHRLPPEFVTSLEHKLPFNTTISSQARSLWVSFSADSVPSC